VGTFDLKLELDQRERRAVGHCLLASRSRLIETIGDTTRTAASMKCAQPWSAFLGSHQDWRGEQR
jgi:hypothetical protein